MNQILKSKKIKRYDYFCSILGANNEIKDVDKMREIVIDAVYFD